MVRLRNVSPLPFVSLHYTFKFFLDTYNVAKPFISDRKEYSQYDFDCFITMLSYNYAITFILWFGINIIQTNGWLSLN